MLLTIPRNIRNRSSRHRLLAFGRQYISQNYISHYSVFAQIIFEFGSPIFTLLSTDINVPFREKAWPVGPLSRINSRRCCRFLYHPLFAANCHFQQAIPCLYEHGIRAATCHYNNISNSHIFQHSSIFPRPQLE